MEKKPEHIFDEWLILKYQSGDKSSLAILVKRWYPKILKQAYWHLKNVEISKDIAQESWYAIINGIHKIKDPAYFGVWAMKITSRKAIDWIRKKQKDRERAGAKIEVQKEFSGVEEKPNDEIINNLRKAIKKLPDKQRVILSLFYLENYSINEISEILNISKGTIKSRLFHAREHLKTTLKKYYYER